MISQTTIQEAVARALVEDIGPGDITTQATVSRDTLGRATLLAKASGIVCGIDVAREVFHQVDADIRFNACLADGDRVLGNREVIAYLEGRASSILTAERVALNFMQRMSGVASITAMFVDAIAGTSARIIDTRKTTPGMRSFEKYAVLCGGGTNHRYGLGDGVLIKDNHIVAAGGVKAAIDSARTHAHHLLKIEIEAKELSQVSEAIEAGADVILLDNMTLDQLRNAVTMIAGRAITEASGRVSLSTVRAIAETGVNLISVGALTHSAPSLDISLDMTTNA